MAEKRTDCIGASPVRMSSPDCRSGTIAVFSRCVKWETQNEGVVASGEARALRRAKCNAYAGYHC
jgi:hypothetical protein